PRSRRRGACCHRPGHHRRLGRRVEARPRQDQRTAGHQAEHGPAVPFRALARLSQLAEGEELRPNQAPLPDWIDDAQLYSWYAERWQWTPDQVDALPLQLVDDWPLMMRAIDEGRQRKHD